MFRRFSAHVILGGAPGATVGARPIDVEGAQVAKQAARSPILSRVALVLALLTPACARVGGTSPVAPARLDFVRVADSIVSSPPLHRAHIGVLVYEPATRRVLYQHNAERHFVPASNEKLWATTTALQELGPDFRYRTPVLAVGLDHETGSAGALVVVGRGDPTFSARFLPERGDSSGTAQQPQLTEEARYQRDLWVLRQMADSVAAAGVKRVLGDLIVDASYFDEAIIPGSWTFGNLNGTSAPPTGAFVVTEGIFRISVGPGAEVGAPASITPWAPAGVVPVLNRVITTLPGSPRQVANARGPWSDSLRFRGAVALGANPQTSQFPMTDPVRFAAHAFADALRARGVAIEGHVRVVRDSAEAAGLREGRLDSLTGALPVREVAAWSSPPMSEIVTAILAPSQNWIAEQLLRTLGAEKGDGGGFRDGIEVEEAFLFGTVGIDSTELSLQDGSGMSNQNLVTPSAVVRLLDFARTAAWGPVFREALAAPGKDGTLENRLRNLEGRLSGKTGTLSNVNALSGYLRTHDGRDLIFSVLSNASGLGGNPVVSAIDRMVEALADGAVPR
jgi:D-alanyl-D-alanine carboxypeptidase/D-alanyl-D-alanine-endopeptidase (penicillin-binding protein 4)